MKIWQSHMLPSLEVTQGPAHTRRTAWLGLRRCPLPLADVTSYISNPQNAWRQSS
jgi:hypothetical protein